MLLIFSFSNCFTSKEHYQCFYHQLSICEMSWFAFLLTWGWAISHMGLLLSGRHERSDSTQGKRFLLWHFLAVPGEHLNQVLQRLRWRGLVEGRSQMMPPNQPGLREHGRGASCSRGLGPSWRRVSAGAHSGFSLGHRREAVQAGWVPWAASSAAGFLPPSAVEAWV